MGNRILIVDDEPDALKTLKARLEVNGYEVISAASGEECLKKAAKEKPDLILLDVLLTGSSGFGVCELLKKTPDTRDIPVIMLTALFGRLVDNKRLESGAAQLISKPFDPEDLLLEIKNIIKR